MTEATVNEVNPAVQVVIGVDTHQDQHVAVSIAGRVTVSGSAVSSN